MVCIMPTPATPSSPAPPPSTPFFQGWRGALVLFVAVVAPLLYLHTIRAYMPPNKADMVAVWKGTQATFAGRNPYADATTREIQHFYYGRELTPADHWNPMGFAYPLHTVVLFAPISVLNWPQVRLFFLILLPLVTAAGILLWIRVIDLQLNRGQMAVTLILCLFSWPSIWGIHQIQPTLLVAALAAAGCFLLQRGNPTAAGVLLAMATIKPQLIAVLIAWLLLWAALKGIWRLLASFAVTLAALLCCAHWLLPDWVESWRQASAEYASYRHLEIDLQSVLGRWPGLVAIAAIALSACVILWRNRHCAPASREFGAMCALSLALTVALLPDGAGMNYNQVLLFPACLLLAYTKPAATFASLFRLFALGLVAWNFLTVPVSALGVIFIAPSDTWYGLPFQSLLLPTAILIAFLSTVLPASLASVATPAAAPQPA
jgi:hypothetical protein